MASDEMMKHAKGWKSPEERKAMKRAMMEKDPPRGEVKKAGKVASKAPPNSTKNSPDSKDGGPNGWTKGVRNAPKGC